jgi:hypothetical protein
LTNCSIDGGVEAGAAALAINSVTTSEAGTASRALRPAAVSLHRGLAGDCVAQALAHALARSGKMVEPKKTTSDQG